MHMIEVHDLYRRFNDMIAVNKLNFTVEKGEIFGLLGPNGAGKTTTINMLVGLLTPTNGYALINGINVAEQPLKVKSIIGYLSESPAMYEKLTGREFLTLICRLRKLNNYEKLIEKFVGMLDLKDYIDNMVESYSKGTRQKIAVISAVIHVPEVLFLDEPTLGLDPRFGLLVKGWIKEFSRKGKTVVMATHNTDVAEKLCNRVMIMDKGRCIGIGTPRKLIERTKTKNLEDVFIKLTVG